jgi:glycine oxidase
VADISCDIAVIGAGVLGLGVAAELTLRGRDVRVVDPGAPNASSVAAGMIAPAFESLLDGADPARAALLRDAAALWPGFAARTGVILDTTPAEWRGGDADSVADRLAALGFAVERVWDVIRASGDVRIDPTSALKQLAASLLHPVILAEAEAIERGSSGWRIFTGAGDLSAGQLVIATGVAPAIPGLSSDVAERIEGVTPIAGQIGRLARAVTDRVLRGPEGYVAPGEGGAVIGATMVQGRDMAPDPVASTRLIAAAERLLRSPLGAQVEWRGGVRGATADGLPLAGRVCDGLHLALAPRRNGWLLGPLVGRIVADGIEGRPRGSHATAFDPLRFSLPAG